MRSAVEAQTCPYINLGEENKEENGLLIEPQYKHDLGTWHTLYIVADRNTEILKRQQGAGRQQQTHALGAGKTVNRKKLHFLRCFREILEFVYFRDNLCLQHHTVAS